MDAAAKTVESLSQQVLPERPHHLSYSPQWRYRPTPPEAAVDGPASGASTRFEEWHNTRLQYMTLVSQADRGTLLTRSYYDMREEPPKPVPREVSALSASGGERKKKLSLSDYKNKKTGAAACTTPPPEPLGVAKRESDGRLGPSSPSAASASNMVAPVSAAPRPASSSSNKPPASSAAKGAPHSQPPPSSLLLSVEEKRLLSEGRSADAAHNKPPSKQLPGSSPRQAVAPSSNKKRMTDHTGEARPPKRPRSDDRRSTDDRPQAQQHDDASWRRERPPNAATDTWARKDDRPPRSVPSSLPNGKATAKGSAPASAHPSPDVLPHRSESLNGIRPNSANSTRSTPTKADTTRACVPPLLSPLHLSFDQSDAFGSEPPNGNSKTAKRKGGDDDGDSISGLSKIKRSDAAAGRRIEKSPAATIPPLLSPTLPAAVEAELLKRKPIPQPNASNPAATGRSRDPQPQMAPATRKKRAVTGNESEERNRLGHRRRLIVILSIPKRLRPSFKRMMGSPSGTTDGGGREGDGERDGSEDGVPAAPMKRRRGSAAEVPAEPLAGSRRTRALDVSGPPRPAAGPATPSKKTGAATSGPGSGNGGGGPGGPLAQTPGDRANATPPTERRVNGQELVQGKAEQAAFKLLVEKEQRLKRKGTSLKHDADLIIRSHRSPKAASGPRAKSGGESRVKLGHVLGLESIIAFVMAFQSQNLWRGMASKSCDPASWASIFPLIEFMQSEMRKGEASSYQPLQALLLLLQALCLDELIKCYVGLEKPSAQIGLDGLVKLERKRARLGPMMREANAAIASPGLRANVRPWYTIDDMTDAALRILRRWCADEEVEWPLEPMLRDDWPVKAPASGA